MSLEKVRLCMGTRVLRMKLGKVDDDQLYLLSRAYVQLLALCVRAKTACFSLANLSFLYRVHAFPCLSMWGELLCLKRRWRISIALEHHWDYHNKLEIGVELATQDVLSVAHKNKLKIL